jgi:hypothetical protein
MRTPEEETLDQPPAEEPRLTALVRASFEDALVGVDFARLGAAVHQEIEAIDREEPLPSPASAALAAWMDGALSAVDFGAFARGVTERIDALVAEELESADPRIGHLLRQDAEHEGAGAWSALGQPDPLAVERFRREVRGELRAMEPRFEGPFRSEVEDRLPARTRARRPHADRGRWRWGALAAVAAALLVAIVQPPGSVTVPPPSGEINVDAVSFEGTVTVTRDQGVAVIWLASGPT